MVGGEAGGNWFFKEDSNNAILPLLAPTQLVLHSNDSPSHPLQGLRELLKEKGETTPSLNLRVSYLQNI